MAIVAKKPALDLAIVMGPPRGKHSDKGMHAGDSDEDEDEDEKPEGDEESELPAGFEEAFAEAFPEASGDMEKMQALKRLIHLCADSY